MTVLTLGLWLVSWVAICFGAVFRPWRCTHCGWHDPQFGTSDHTEPGKSRWPIGRRRKSRNSRLSPSAPTSMEEKSGAASKRD